MPAPKTKNDPNAKLTDYVKDYTSAMNYKKDNYHDLWFRCYSVYNQKRVKIGIDSISDQFVPETRTIVESLVANIAGGKPRFVYIPSNDQQSTDTEVLTQLMDYYWDCNRMGTKAQSWVRDAILYGTGVLMVNWDYQRQCPIVSNIPLRDFFVDSTAVSPDPGVPRFMGHRWLGDIEVMKKETVIDPETGETVPKYRGLDQIQAGNTSDNSQEDMDKVKKEQLQGSTLGVNNERQCEVITIYYRDGRLVEIANRCEVIRDVESPLQQEEKTAPVEVTVNGQPQMQDKTIEAIKPFFPYAVLRNVVDPSLFFGTGDVEAILDLQEQLNDVENLDMDNLQFANNIMWRIDPAYEDMAADIESSPGIVIPIPRNALEPIEKPRLDGDLDTKKVEIQERMRRVTAADEILQGSQTDARTTATEISAVTTQAMARFKTKVTNLESEGFAQLGSILFKMAQIFLDQKTVVRIVGPEGVAFKDFDPFEFSGYYEPHVKLDSTVKEQQADEAQKIQQFVNLALGMPNANRTEALRIVAKSLKVPDEDVQRLLSPEQPAPGMLDAIMPQVQDMIQQAMQAEKAQPKGIAESIKWTPADLTPQERAQALAQGGIMPDPAGATPNDHKQALEVANTAHQHALDIHQAGLDAETAADQASELGGEPANG